MTMLTGDFRVLSGLKLLQGAAQGAVKKESKKKKKAPLTSDEEKMMQEVVKGKKYRKY